MDNTAVGEVVAAGHEIHQYEILLHLFHLYCYVVAVVDIVAEDWCWYLLEQ